MIVLCRKTSDEDMKNGMSPPLMTDIHFAKGQKREVRKQQGIGVRICADLSVAAQIISW
jgi:hypothetical protein